MQNFYEMVAKELA
jgi:hypothetical protein